MNKPSQNNEEREIVLFYPTDSLMRQVAEWAAECPGMSVRVVTPTTPSAVRRALGERSLALLDATERPLQAMDALVHVIEEKGADGAAVYTERVHEGLEIFIRMRGVLLLLGPMPTEEWQDLLCVLRRRNTVAPGRLPPLRVVRWSATA